MHHPAITRSHRPLTHHNSTQPNPADLNTICGVDASKVISQIKSLCGSNIDAAMTSFADTCNSAGKAIGMYSLTLSHT